MKLEGAALDIETSGFGATSQFTIAASPQAFDILTSNIYENKIRAVIREVSCNALDAHVAAGVSRPFDVHLPTSYEPWFSVRDFGNGLSQGELVQIYTTFFMSTKSNSNEYVGAFGLGSKSPFCLVDSFTIISYYDGIKSTYCCYRAEDRSLKISLVNEIPCGSETGLEVIIEGQTGDYKGASFRQEAIEVFSYFNSVPNVNIPEVTDAINNKISSFTVVRDGFVANFKARVDYNSCVAVMGNVCYRIPQEFRFKFPVRIYFNIGDLSVNPGRESLSLDSKTKAMLEKRLREVQAAIPAVYIEELLKIENSWDRLVFGELTYPVVMHLLSEDRKKQFKEAMPEKVKSLCYTLKGKRPIKSYCEVTTVTNSEGKTPVYFHSKQRSGGQICAYVKANKTNAFILTEKDIKDLCIPVDLVKDTTSLPRASRSYSREKFDFYVYDADSSSFTKEVVDEDFSSDDIIYVKMERGISEYPIRHLELAEEYLAKYGIAMPRIYGFNGNMVKKFGGVNFLDWFLKVIKVKKLRILNHLRYENNVAHAYISELILKLAAESWNNKLIEQLFNSLKDAIEGVNSDSHDKFIYNTFCIRHEVDCTADEIYKKILDKFPLLTIINPCRTINSSTLENLKKYIELTFT